MSISKHHQEWLSLLEISGPFLAMPVVTKVFPHGLPKFDSKIKKELRVAYQEWMGSQEDPILRTSYQTAWIRFVLKEVLGFPTELIAEGSSIPPGYTVTLSEHGEQISPDIAIIVPEGRELEGRARLLVSSNPSNQQLERTVPPTRSKWGASPATRMMELLRRTSTELGIVTNGEQWMLVYAPAGETVSFVSWYASVWMEEDITLLSFHGLLSVARLFGVSADETLEALFRASTEYQQEVTDQLGIQVRKAVELLIQALDRIDKDTGRSLLKDVSVKQLYEAGVSVMMRLVFLLAAEERGLFPLNNEIYSSNYAVSTLREQLQESASRHGESVLEHRFDAWNRLLATFRVIHAGCRHEDFNSPAYGGSLFDPDKYPFLEGRPMGTTWFESEVDPLAINNRTVLHLLDSLQLLKGRGPKDEARKLSFRAIDVEQIGTVYESLLEHTAVRANEPVLGLVGSKGKEPEVPLSALLSRKETGELGLLKWLAEETGKTDKALSKLLYQIDKFPESKCLMVCDNDSAIYSAVKPFFGLVREDTLDMPVVFTPGSVYVTEGSERRLTGTHYTPRSMTDPIVENALNPLVYAGMSGGVTPTPETLRSPSELLELKICDMACGSGAFLVQSCRYLAEKLLESWRNCEVNLPAGTRLDIDGHIAVSESAPDERTLIPIDSDDRVMLARRLVTDRCLYGVDCNPMAVEMAKLSLWLTTLQRNRPFTFVDHAIKCGDSLVGLTRLNEVKYFDLHVDETMPPRRLSEYTSELVESAKDKRVTLERIADVDICDTETKERLHNQAETDLRQAKYVADLLIAASAQLSKGLNQLRSELDRLSLEIASGLAHHNDSNYSFLQDLHRNYITNLSVSAVDFVARAPFHWVLEFPEVFLRENGGFDCIVGNPPFIGGQKITGHLGTEYRDYLVNYIGKGKKGSADICAYFFLRAFALIRIGGTSALLATNTVCEGDTREVGLDQITTDGGTIYRAVKSSKWPGTANLEVAQLWLSKGAWGTHRVLDGSDVSNISPYLKIGASDFKKPVRLSANSNLAFIGSYVLGTGFLIQPSEATSLLNECGENKQVLLPYLNGDDVNSSVDQCATRWAINFSSWPLSRNSFAGWSTASLTEQKQWLKEGTVPSDYPNPVAADYPQCLQIIEERVKPERTRKNEKGDYVVRYPRWHTWWLFAERSPALYEQISSLPRVLAIPLVSKHLVVCWQDARQIFSHMLGVIATDSDGVFAILQSTIHEIWARQCGSTLETRMRYTPSDCFETFPFPNGVAILDDLGKRYQTARQNVSQQFQEGLTKTYNRVHSKKDKHTSVIELRTLHAEIDKTVLNAYGWNDISLDHNFRATERGDRFTISEKCRQQILDRLFSLNQERHLEELSKGISKPKKKGNASRRDKSEVTGEGSKANSRQITLDLRTTTSIGADHDE